MSKPALASGKPAAAGFIWRNGVKVRLSPGPVPISRPTKAPEGQHQGRTADPGPAALVPSPAVRAPEHQALEVALVPSSPGEPPAGQHQAPSRRRRPWMAHLARDEAPADAFAFVWGVGEGAPRVRHETVEGARGEARRLAAACPGVRFLVYRATLVPDPQDTEGAREADSLPASPA